MKFAMAPAKLAKAEIITAAKPVILPAMVIHYAKRLNFAGTALKTDQNNATMAIRLAATAAAPAARLKAAAAETKAA